MKKLWEKIKNKIQKFKIILLKIKFLIYVVRYGLPILNFYSRIKEKKNKKPSSNFNFYKRLNSYKLPLILLIFSMVAIFALYYIYTHWISAPDFSRLTEIEQKAEEIHSGVIRNRGWLAWMVFSLVGLLAGIILTTWGRIIQHKSHLHERLEKATAMLGSKVMGMRIAGCRLLMSLGIEDKNMKVLCVRLLFAFINNPYLKEEDEDKNPNDLFSDAEKPLRADIQEAANSFSAIYNHYWRKGIDNDPVDLPLYFWKNQYKNYISLIKANLKGVKLHGAILRKANLRGANFSGADLQEADFREADLRGSILRKVELQRADFREANLQRLKLDVVFLEEANLSGANLQKVSFNAVILDKADLSGAKLQKANFNAANLNEVNLKGAKLQGANFIFVNLKKADMTDAIIYYTNLTKEQILSTIWGVDESGKGLPPSTLSKELIDDLEMQKWLGSPHYNKNKKAKKAKGKKKSS